MGSYTCSLGPVPKAEDLMLSGECYIKKGHSSSIKEKSLSYHPQMSAGSANQSSNYCQKSRQFRSFKPVALDVCRSRYQII